MVSSADYRIRISERGVVGEIRRIRGEFETHSLVDPESLVNRSVDHVQARAVNVVAVIVAKCAGCWLLERTEGNAIAARRGVKPLIDGPALALSHRVSN